MTARLNALTKLAAVSAVVLLTLGSATAALAGDPTGSEEAIHRYVVGVSGMV